MVILQNCHEIARSYRNMEHQHRSRISMAPFRTHYKQCTEWKCDKEFVSLPSTTRLIKGITQRIWINLEEYITCTNKYKWRCCNVSRFHRCVLPNYIICEVTTCLSEVDTIVLAKCVSVLQTTMRMAAQNSFEASEPTDTNIRNMSPEDYNMGSYAWSVIVFYITVLTYILIPRSRILLKNLTGSRLVNKFSAFYGTRRLITAFTNARHLSLSCARSIQSMARIPFPEDTS